MNIIAQKGSRRKKKPVSKTTNRGPFGPLPAAISISFKSNFFSGCSEIT